MELIVRRCNSCKLQEKLEYRCNLKWCPRCQWRLADARKLFVERYAGFIEQPKHLVLTQKNCEVLTRKKMRENQIAMAELRRRICFEKVRGGCASVEVTWNPKGAVVNGHVCAGGFHIHSHWLISASWVDIQEVKLAWADLIGQDFAICEIYDAREEDYVKELCKYVVEGSEIAGWPAEVISQFVHAVRGVRCFFTFGNLRKLAKQIRAEIAKDEARIHLCECGSTDCKVSMLAENLGEEEKMHREAKQFFKAEKAWRNSKHKAVKKMRELF